ncbi:helix-turn-helix domain-containing protein [Rhodanobacter sp. FW102-FHT14D06]|jgi:AraC-like DNA-binding protein|uniref:Helix-turn-helix domain-containing protein n=2 Tax=unclassified Rhodanobacter TaxID=2621553 RepID=A0AB74UM15_9GAMM|nr:MAG: AraC family transcriptional regulator [Rhodanobacter sp. SCN 67-45]
MRDRWEWQATFLGRIASQGYVEGLFDRLADIVYSIKDRQGRYVLMSAAAVARCHLPSKAHAVGLTAFDLFPAPMAERYARQDEQVFRTGKPVLDSLDLTLYPDHATGWCISTKMPLHDSAGQVVGLACVSRDLHEPGRSAMIDSAFADAVEYMHAHLCEPLREMQLERLSGLTAAQFERRMRKLFQLSPARYLLKLRIDSAAQWLVRTDKPIGEIAQLTGFCDQSGLSRHFRNLTGLTPRQYRQLNRPGI